MPLKFSFYSPQFSNYLDVFSFAEFRDSLNDGRNKRLRDGYGLPRTLLLLFAFPDGVQIIDRIDKDILGGKEDGSAMRMRDAICAKYNQVAVAAAIMAQIGITALSLPDVDRTHWTAQASFVMSLVTGCLSVFYCCTTQSSFGSLITAEDVKDWLCKPGEWQGLTRESARHRYDSEKAASQEELAIVRRDLFAHLDEDCWKTPSINAALVLVAPLRLLYISLGMLINGLGIYLIVIASKNLQIGAGANASLALLIVYILTVVGGLLLFYVPDILKKVESVPSNKVKREASSIHLFLEAFKGLDELESLFTDLQATEDDGEIQEQRPAIQQKLEDLDSTLETLTSSRYKPGQEAIKQLERRIREIEKRRNIRLVRTDFGRSQVELRPLKVKNSVLAEQIGGNIGDQSREKFKSHVSNGKPSYDNDFDTWVTLEPAPSGDGLPPQPPQSYHSSGMPGKRPSGNNMRPSMRKQGRTFLDIVQQSQLARNARQEAIIGARAAPRRQVASTDDIFDEVQPSSRTPSPNGTQLSKTDKRAHFAAAKKSKDPQRVQGNELDRTPTRDLARRLFEAVVEYRKVTVGRPLLDEVNRFDALEVVKELIGEASDAQRSDGVVRDPHLVPLPETQATGDQLLDTPSSKVEPPSPEH